jgi:hypothetical protein
MGYLFGQKRRKVGRLQRQAARCFLVTQGASSAELSAWCWPRVVLIEKRALTECERTDSSEIRGSGCDGRAGYVYANVLQRLFAQHVGGCPAPLADSICRASRRIRRAPNDRAARFIDDRARAVAGRAGASARQVRLRPAAVAL